jgi:hypothetical protein
MRTVHVDWDSGSSLGLVLGEDEYLLTDLSKSNRTRLRARYVVAVSALGVRCHKNALTYVLLDGTTDAPVVISHDHVEVPKTERKRGDQLVWVRKEVREIIQRASPDIVAFKAPETVAPKKDLGRAEVEGVFQEAACELGLYPIRRIKSQIRSDVKFKPAARYLDSLLGQFPALQALPTNRREAALAALAALANA